MSLHPQPVPAIPQATASTARAAFPRGNRYMTMRDELGSLYTDHDFVSLYAVRGQPGFAPWRLALVLVFQFAEALSDEQAADAVRSRIDWKYALSLDLNDAGFDASILSEFRDRLITGSLELHLLDTMLVRFKELGLLKARGRQRTDSTHVLAAVRALNRLQCVGETVRHALNSLAVAAPDWLAPLLEADWLERYASRFDEYRLPKAEAERQALAEQIGADGRTLLQAVWHPTAPAWLRNLPAVETLRRVWLQQFYALAPAEPMRWRVWADLPPAAQMLNTPYDDEARYSIKRNTVWTGYKVHLTETCDEDSPHLITHVLTTPATTPDWNAPEIIHPALAAKALLPGEHLLDAGYVSSDVVVTSQQEQGIRVIGPLPIDNHWQAKSEDGISVACFSIDWEAKVVTCPQGQRSRKWSQTHDSRGNEIINIRFGRDECAACEVGSRCTRSSKEGRNLTLRPQAQHEALQQARQYQQTEAFQAEYEARAGIEGTLSQGVRVAGLRQSRYVGLAKTRLQHILTAAALNLRRVGEWYADTPRARTRTAPFVALAQRVGVAPTA